MGAALLVGPPGTPQPTTLVAAAAAAVRALEDGLGQELAFGWAAPGDRRVWAWAPPCAADDPPVTVTLTPVASRAVAGGSSLRVATPSAVVPERDETVPRDAPLSDLRDFGATVADGLPAGTYRLGHVTCRSLSEGRWGPGLLTVASTDGAVTEDGPLSAWLLPETPASGLAATVLLHARDEPVRVEALGFAPEGSGTGVVLVGVGHAEDQAEWWSMARYVAAVATRGAVGEVPPPVPSVRPFWQRPGPAPSLEARRADELGVEMTPWSAAVVFVGPWSFDPRAATVAADALEAAASPSASSGGGGAAGTLGVASTLVGRLPTRPQRLVSFPTLTYGSAGAERTVGFTAPFVAASGHR